MDTLASLKQSWWQILPLGPTGAGNSPYQSFSAFAGNINLLSPELLAREGLVSLSDLATPPFPVHRVDYDQVIPWKKQLLRAAYSNFRRTNSSSMHSEFEAYCEKERFWLDDYSLFMTIRAGLGEAAVAQWPHDLKQRSPAALAALEQAHPDEVQMHRFGQFLFDRQWSALRAYARQQNVYLIGDAPIFVALDSADVWANPSGYLLHDDLTPKVVAGVPPDYFSEDGQYWGNPIYDWDAMKATGYSWWVNRIRRLLEQVDLVRLDHFRGFAQAYHIPGTESTARVGTWIDGPRDDFFLRLKSELGSLPIIAEDLGIITPDVVELREAFDLPGMRVIQFMLGGPDNTHWPHNYETNTICYTGTHDNETTLGWYQQLPQQERDLLAHYLGRTLQDPAHDLIRLAWLSTAKLAIAPLQDLLRLGNEARMNRPNQATGCWEWRFQPEQFHSGINHWLVDLTRLANRIATPRLAN